MSTSAKTFTPYFASQAIVILGLLLLPYYLFGGKLFIGGDDSRLFYAYPLEFIQAAPSSSWYTFSGIGLDNPSQAFLPMLYLLTALDTVIPSKVVLSYLAFSAPPVLGFIFFQKFLAEVIRRHGRYRAEILLGGLFYVLSPILIINQLSVFLTSVWLIALLPITLFYFARYLKTGRFLYVVLNIGWSTLLSIGLYAIPWLLGFAIPLLLGVGVSLRWLSRVQRVRLLKQSLIFWGLLVVSQAFWLLPFASAFVGGEASSYGSQVLSPATRDTFSSIVNATSHGSILYPLLDLFHRQIAFDFNWDLKHVFSSFYDITRWPNVLFPIVLVSGLLLVRKRLHRIERLVLGGGLVAFIISLLLFTVNVGPFKQVFLWLGYIPGFAIFRNAYDKFALGYILLYAIVLTLLLVVLSRRLGPRLRVLLLVVFGLLVVLNAAPVKRLVDKPLWTTEKTYTTSTIPAEYERFMVELRQAVPATTNVLSVPFGISSYTLIKDEGSDRVFAGKSPVKLFSGINDFSGTLSFSPDIAAHLRSLIVERRYDELRNLLDSYNISYAIETRNIPTPALDSYLFDREVLAKLDQQFRDNLYSHQVVSSDEGNYQLYKLKSQIASGRDDQTVVRTPTTVLAVADSRQLNGPVQLANFRSRTQTVISGPPAPAEAGQLFAVPANDSRLLPTGRYLLPNFFRDVYPMLYDSNRQTLNLQTTPTYRLNNLSYKGETSPLISVDSPDTLVHIHDTFFEPAKIGNYPVRQGDTVTLYEPVTDNLLPETRTIFQFWDQGDCNAYDNASAVEHALTEGEDGQVDLTLRARENHNACISSDLAVREGGLYRLEFDYRTNASKLSLNITFPDGSQKLGTLPGTAGDLQHFSYLFATPTADNIRLYLYSGTGSRLTVSSYRNLLLREYGVTESVDPGAAIKAAKGTPPVTFSAPEPGTFLVPQEGQYLLRDEASFDAWSRGDCNAYDGQPAVFFSNLKQDGGIELQALKGHNACLNRLFTINPNNTYTIEFDYDKRDSRDLSLHVDYEGKGPGETFSLPAESAGWQHYVQRFTPPRAARQMRLYLYSGSNQAGLAATRYRRVQVSYVPQGGDTVSLVRQPERQIAPPGSVQVRKLKNYAYHVTWRSVRGDFLMTFLQSYHSGWKLYAGGADYHWYSTLFARPIEAAHYRADGYANAWWITPDQLCRGTTRCHRNDDGSYDLEMLVEFTPQRFFYLGLLISILTLLGCLSYFAYREGVRVR